jgi:hypothetical protein
MYHLAKGIYLYATSKEGLFHEHGVRLFASFFEHYSDLEAKILVD